MLRLIAAALLVSTAAAADQGEFNFDLVLSPEVASTIHPSSPLDAMPFSDASTFVIKPRLGVGARYGLTSSLYVGLGANAAASTAITTRGVTIDDASGDILTAGYLELAAPVLLGFRLDTGPFVSGALELELAPLAVYWGTNDLVDPTDVDAEGRPQPLKTLQDTWLLGGSARVNLLFTARLWDSFAFDVGPTAAVAWTGTPSVHIGLLLRPGLLWGGPL